MLKEVTNEHQIIMQNFFVYLHNIMPEFERTEGVNTLKRGRISI